MSTKARVDFSKRGIESSEGERNIEKLMMGPGTHVRSAGSLRRVRTGRVRGPASHLWPVCAEKSDLLRVVSVFFLHPKIERAFQLFSRCEKPCTFRQYLYLQNTWKCSKWRNSMLGSLRKTVHQNRALQFPSDTRSGERKPPVSTTNFTSHAHEPAPGRIASSPRES